MEKTPLEAKRLKIPLICTPSITGMNESIKVMDEKLASYRKDCEGIEGPVGRENEMNRKFYKGIGQSNLRPSYHLRAKEAMRGNYKL